MSTFNPPIIEKQIISAKSQAILAIGANGSWEVGSTLQTLHKVQLGAGDINDDTFGFSAVDVEPIGNGNFVLFVRSNDDEDQVVSVNVDTIGQVDLTSIDFLTSQELENTELIFGVDLNSSGGFGGSPVTLKGRPDVTLFLNELGQYLIGSDTSNLNLVTVGGHILDDQLLPRGWEITDVSYELDTLGFTLYVEDDQSNLLAAHLDSKGVFKSLSSLTQHDLETISQNTNSDISGKRNVLATSGWTTELKTPLIKSAVDSAIFNNGKIDHAHLVEMMNDLIQSHINAGGTTLSSIELSDLQAISARGKTVLGSSNGDLNTTDYLSFVFSKMVDGSVANAFYTGGAEKSAPLTSLSVGSSMGQLQKLVDKWLLGTDLPSPIAGGDSATGKAATTVGVYAHSQGNLFVNGVEASDIKQGAIGDCYFAASLLNIASVSPSTISSMFVANSPVNTVRTWGVKFYDADGTANWVTVNDELPVGSVGAKDLIFGGDSNHSLDGEIWFALAEKAYVQTNTLNILQRDVTTGKNAYFAIEGGYGDAIAQIVGHKVTAYSFSADDSSFAQNPYITTQYIDLSDTAAVSRFQSTLKNATTNGHPVWIGSFTSTQDAYGNTLLTSGHAFAATNEKSSISNEALVWNPWGLSTLPNPPQFVNYLSPFDVSFTGLATDENLLIMIG